MRTHVAASLALALSVAACRDAPADNRAPRYVVGLGPGNTFTVINATFLADSAFLYRDERCTAVALRDGAEPPSLNAGRVEAWVVAGDILGHADRKPDGAYQAAVRTPLTAGTPLSASVAGSGDVPAHRFRTPARVPSPVRRTEPSAGFAVRPGAALPVRWEGGSGSHVSITLSMEPAIGQGAGLLVSCVVPRAPGSFAIPAAALSAARVPADASAAQLVVVATERVREGDFAIDVALVGAEADQVTGTVAR